MCVLTSSVRWEASLPRLAADRNQGWCLHAYAFKKRWVCQLISVLRRSTREEELERRKEKRGVRSLRLSRGPKQQYWRGKPVNNKK